MNPTVELLRSHRSIRKFKNEPIPSNLFLAIIKSGQSAASSSFLQGVTVIRVTEDGKRKAFMEITGGQKYVLEAPEFLVFCADLNRPMRCCATLGGVPSKGLTEQFIIATVDVALFAQNVAVAAESFGLGICYIGAIRNDPSRAASILELPQNVYPVFGMCIGWPDQNPEIKPRLPVSVVLKENVYSENDEAVSITCYDEVMRSYYATRSNNRKAQAWSEQMTNLLSREARPHMLKFLQSYGFIKR